MPTKVHLVKAMVFPVVMYGCESWTIKLSAEELMLLNCGGGGLLRVPRTAKRSNQSILKEIRSDQIRSVVQSCLTLCDPMNRSTPGLPVHHPLPEFTQTHVHRVSDAIQPSHSLSSPSSLDPIPPSIRVLSNESTLRMRWPTYWSFSFRVSPPEETAKTTVFSLSKENSKRYIKTWLTVSVRSTEGM